MVESEVLVSLGDPNLGKVAEVLASKSGVRILDLLGKESLTVSEVSEKLNMKLNTVDYNVKKLVSAGLLEKDGHWWSVKGRRMVRYKASEARIVISPRRRVTSKFAWVLGLTGVIALIIRGTERTGQNLQVADEMMFKAVPEVSTVALDGAAGVSEVGVNASFWAGLASWEWFLIGAWASVVLFFVWSMIVERKR